MEQALSEGALDVFTTPVQMKKNRPGTLLTVLARTEDEERLRALLFRESRTLGVRTRHEKRYALAAAVTKRRDAMGRGAHEGCQHEWHGLAVRARV